MQQRYLPCTEHFLDHFRRCVLRHLKGARESNDTERHFDPDIDLRAEGGLDLTAGNSWSSSEGKKQLKVELPTRTRGVGLNNCQ